MTELESANVAVIRKRYEEVFNQNRLELLPESLCEDFIFHAGTEERGIEAYRGITERLRVAFDGMQFTIHDLIASGD